MSRLKVVRPERRLFVMDDADGVAAIWTRDHRTWPTPVLYAYAVDDEALWAAIVKLVESGGVA